MNGLWKLATDAISQASALGAQAAGAVSPHANSALNAAKSVQISEEQIKAAKRAAEAVGQASAGAAVAAGAALAPHAKIAFNTIKSVHIPKEHLDAAAVLANQAAVGKVAAAVQRLIGSAAAGMHASIGNVVAGSVFAGLQSAGVVGLSSGACAVAAGLGGAAGHFLDELTKKKGSKL